MRNTLHRAKAVRGRKRVRHGNVQAEHGARRSINAMAGPVLVRAGLAVQNCGAVLTRERHASSMALDGG